jgi:Fe-S oxidoreductase
MGIPPLALLSAVEFAEEEIYEETGIKVRVPINKKGAEILYVPPSADFFGGPHWGTFIGAIKLFHYLGLDYTLSSRASEGGNFGTWLNYEHAKKINRKIYEEAIRLGVKWILGGECGHMYRVVHAFMATMNGDLAEKLEVPVSPITGTKFVNAQATKMIHICEFEADLIKHKKLELDPSRNDQYIVTFSDSCNPARVMGLIEEPRYVLRHVCNKYVELDPNVNREKTVCCTAGGGLLTDETLELRLKAIKPKIDAIKKTGANFLAFICAIDKAAYSEYIRHYKLNIKVGGVTELLGNALILENDGLKR